MSPLPAAQPVRSTESATRVEAVHHAPPRTCDYDGVQGEDGDRRSTTDLCETLTDRGVSARLDERALRLTPVPLSEPLEGNNGSYLGVPQLQPDPVVQPGTQTPSGSSVRVGSETQSPSPTASRVSYSRETHNPRANNALTIFNDNCKAKNLFLHSFLSPVFSQQAEECCF
jgi:hypothetical protein